MGASIPSQLVNCQNLLVLDLRVNLLHGRLLGGLFKCILGSIPKDIGNSCEGLTVLSIKFVKLCGSNPASLG